MKEIEEFIHCSFDTVEEFVPRIPKTVTIDENISIPRICCGTDVLSCIRATPMNGQVIHNMMALGLPVVVCVYYLGPSAYMENSEVSKYVPDALSTGEV